MSRASNKKNGASASNGVLAPKKDPATLVIYQTSAADMLPAAARTLASPAAQASQTMFAAYNKAWGESGILNAEALRNELIEQAKAINAGDLTRVENQLNAQAHTLDALFNVLARRAIANINEGYLPAGETYMRLALKAQGQCRATLETLGAIKNPPVVIARQANVANGPQQINNNLAPRAEENQNPQIKLSEEANELRQNTGTPAIESAADLALAALGALDGAANAGRKGARVAKPVQGG